MTNSLFAILFLLLIPVSALPAEKFKACVANPNAMNLVSYWARDSTVRVYFVHDMFTLAQSQTLRETMEAWTSKGNHTASRVTFVYAGETGGLIDCYGCLTVARQDSFTKDRKSNALFHPLRQDEVGQLISAWIGLDSATSSPEELRGLILQMLGRNVGSSRC